MVNSETIFDLVFPGMAMGENTVLCPFHFEKTPSMNINTVQKIYHCFGCGAHGNDNDFIEQYYGISKENIAAFKEALFKSELIEDYEHFSRNQEDLDRNETKVSCLVCGSTNTYVDLGMIRVFTMYEDGSKSIDNIKKKDALAHFQKECGGYVEAKSLPSLGITLWFNEDARLDTKKFLPNFNATRLWVRAFGNTDNTVLLGNVVVSATETDEHGYPTSLTPEQLAEYMEEN